jgi:uncharacterized protein YjbI with pentapeptide repeats
MMKRWFLQLALFALVLAEKGPARSETVAAEPSCASAYGDIWGESEPDVARREIGGGQIKSLSNFVRMTDRRVAVATIVKGGNFAGWDFGGTSLSGICFKETDLAGANFAHASAPGVGFIKADMTDANMTGAAMRGVLFRNAGLKNVMAMGADFPQGHFDGCPVYQGGAAISAKGADFSHVTLHSFGLYDVDLTQAILDQTIIGPGQLPYLAKAKFRGDIILRGGGSDARLIADEAQKLSAENTAQKAAEAYPSFDCVKAASKVEQEICGEYASDLRSADRDIAALYQRAKASDAGVEPSQLAWLKQRNLCEAAEYPSDCIRGSYSLRKGQLLGLLDENDWLARGESALFIDDVLPLPPAFMRSDLYARVVPVLIGASMIEILIERGNDGLYAIKGSAVGANAHLCSIYAPHLYLDKETGWYIPVSKRAATPIFRIFDDRLEIFAGGRPDYEKYPEAADFMSCGMRASFSVAIRINASDELIESYRQSLNEEV